MTRSKFRNFSWAITPVASRWPNTYWRGLISALGVLAICIAARYYWGARVSRAQSPVAYSQPPATMQAAPAAPGRSLIPEHQPIPEIVATINGQPVTRSELAQECRVQYGKEVLEAMVNKALILQKCRELGIAVSRQDVDREIEQMAKSFNMSPEQWLQLLQNERRIKPEQYADDIIWPSLALKKLAGNTLMPTPEEIRAAYETEYGPAVKARVIICSNLDKAKRVQAQAAAATNPDDFGNLAKTESEDAPSACVKGLIQPIRRNGPCPEVEKIAFAMADGQVSEVIPSAGQYVIVKREGLIGGNAIPLQRVQPRLEKIITEKKLRGVAGGIFKQLQANAKIQNVINDPQLRMQFGPGVVALVNGAPIYQRQLDEECMARHGAEILDSLVNRRIVEMACRSQNVVVTEQDIDAEVARAALDMMKPLPDGKPDGKKWLDVVSHNQGVTPAVYRATVLWPTVALRKLAAGKVEVTNEDIQKGLEANYGKRVRCRAIVLNNDRKAEEVWEKARQSMTGALAANAESFGDLAAKYSIEGSSRALRGVVPPIGRNHGQPMLEEEAFKLKPGELSGVIHLETSKSVILFCEGYTDPVQVDFAMIRDELIADIRQKKERLAMSDYFDRLQSSAAITNVLDPAASHAPRKTAAAGPPSSVVPVSYMPPAAAIGGR